MKSATVVATTKKVFHQRKIERENALRGNWLNRIGRLLCHFTLVNGFEMTEHQIGRINTKCGEVDKVDNFLSVKVLFTQ